MSHTNIQPSDLMDKKADSTCIVDVRTGAEVKSVYLAGCLHIPLHELTAERLNREIETAQKDPETIYLLCQSGQRSELAANQLKGKIAGKLVIVDDGINGMKQVNIPLQTSAQQTVSLERQVRITAGILVVLGTILGALVNPIYYGLSAFVGAGLTFAGITNTCGMGMLIARMPWNR